ncbi:MAG: OmpA family protein [Chitinophagales bacterium]|nr:OmpA family protein [Chitinophagales bacterium]
MSSLILGILSLVLLFVVVLQISKVSDLIKALKNDKEEVKNHSKSALYLAIVGLVMLIYAVISTVTSAHKFLPTPATEQGMWVNNLMNTTIVITGIMFFVTQILLFYFVYKYHYRKDRKALYYPDNHKLELAWTVVPAIVLTALIGLGISKWLKVFSDAPTEAVVIEVTGKQFSWIARYPGQDRKLGMRDFTLVTLDNELGVNWSDKDSHDDFIADEIVLPVNKPVLVNIGALDVIHSFYIPEFRMMLDAVPGIPTKLWFTPTITTEEMRKETNNPEFDYWVACNQLCGSGHYNMKKKVVVVSEEEYKKWVSEQASYYETVVKPALDAKAAEAPATQEVAATDNHASTYDLTLENGFGLKGALNGGVEQKLVEFIKSDKPVSKDLWFSFDRLLFESGSDKLVPSSQEQLKNIAEILNAYPNVEIKIGGYTDNTGDAKENLNLSSDRAKSVMAELVKLGVDKKRLKAEGYGEEHPVASNDTAEGRQQNRRIDIRVTKK